MTALTSDQKRGRDAPAKIAKLAAPRSQFIGESQTAEFAAGFSPQDPTLLLVKDHRTQVWAYRADYLGKPHFQIREVHLNVDNEWAPCKHGLFIRPEQAAEFCLAVATLKFERGS
jgi:hypothetical protein